MVADRRPVPLALSFLLVALLVACSDPAAEGLDEDIALRFTTVSAGVEHTCALAQTGSIYCWGADGSGQLGNAAAGDSPRPVRAESAERFAALAAGAQHTCALGVAGELFCWGNNNYGQLGNGTTVTLQIPVIIPTEARFAQITSGLLHSCALTAAGQAFCWGAGGQGQLGTGRYISESRPAPVAGDLRFAQLTGGGYHTCGITVDRRIYCWGQNSAGQLGTNNLLNTAAPALAVFGRTAREVSAGMLHTCALADNGDAYCWGASPHGELGTSFVSPSTLPGAIAPTPVAEGRNFIQISAGNGFTCGVVTDGSGFCWGRGLEGQLGNGQIRNWPNPQFVTDGERPRLVRFESLEPSTGTHACGVLTSGAVFCWGRGDRGQLGNTVTTFTSSAMRVSAQ